MDPSQLKELESLCVAMYNSHNPAERTHAENALRPFSTNTDYIPQCKVRAATTLHTPHAARLPSPARMPPRYFFSLCAK